MTRAHFELIFEQKEGTPLDKLPFLALKRFIKSSIIFVSPSVHLVTFGKIGTQIHSELAYDAFNLLALLYHSTI
jgi:hypothetical protein